jgi:hypothetical protein
MPVSDLEGGIRDILKLMRHLHMEYISESWYHIPEFFVHISLNMESTEPMVTFRKSYGRHHPLVNRYEICVTNDHGAPGIVLGFVLLDI